MREILFRGKRLKDGKWVYGAFCPKDWEVMGGPMIDKPSIINLEPPLDGFWYAVHPASVGQFTGLTDKNGKKIFDGDIVRAIYRFNKSVICSYTVEYLNGAFMLKQKGVNYHIYFNDLPERNYYIEVIGNIHDNPELLEGAE